MQKIYLDNCCLNRIFDDQSQARIRLETEAVKLVYANIQAGHLEWIGSEALAFEIRKIKNEDF